ncbi:8906_t:CDS:1, partial [Acaulospora morrowiae]
FGEMPDIVSLNFQIDGNNNENEVFTIEISNDKKVDALKPIVKKRLAPLFDTIPSTQIKLSLTPNGGSMKPTVRISKFFNGNPDENEIYVYVTPLNN